MKDPSVAMSRCLRCKCYVSIIERAGVYRLIDALWVICISVQSCADLFGASFPIEIVYVVVVVKNELAIIWSMIDEPLLLRRLLQAQYAKLLYLWTARPYLSAWICSKTDSLVSSQSALPTNFIHSHTIYQMGDTKAWTRKDCLFPSPILRQYAFN